MEEIAAVPPPSTLTLTLTLALTLTPTQELSRCRAATQHRRSERCPHGPCLCRSLGHRPRRPKKVIHSFEEAQMVHAARHGDAN